MVKRQRIHFEDQGQDFLWWDINELDEVIDCGPFQASVWVGCQLIIDNEGGLLEGDRPFFMNQDGEMMRLNYAIEQIEELEVSHA